MSDNPYAAPESVVDTPIEDSELPLHPPRSVSAGRGPGWISEGFGHFKQDPGQWILICIVGFVVMVVISLLPFLNLVSGFLTYVWVGGLMLGCRAQDQGEPLSVSHLFAGFQRKAGPLIGLSAIFLLVVLAVMMIALGPLYMQIISAGMSGDPAAVESAMAEVGAANFMLSILVASLFVIPMIMAVWFAPMLIVLNDVPVFRAIGMSFMGCLKNILPFLLYGLIMAILYVLAVIPLLLGLLVFMPTAFGSMYRAYKDIYVN